MAALDKKRKALGRGLGALLPSSGEGDANAGGAGRTYRLCPVENIRPNKFQPRKTFDDEKLAELVASIREQGIIQPIIVRKEGERHFELIAGERRWRAAQKAGLKEVPIIVKEASDRESLELAIIENVQRDDLNPLEEAEGYQRLMDEFSYTQEELASRVGKERATIANFLRILNLPDEVKRSLASGLLTMGHAKALLSLKTTSAIVETARRVAKLGLSVRETEALAKKAGEGTKKGKPADRKDPNLAGLEDRLTSHLGTRARIIRKGQKGKLEIEFYSTAELERLLEVIGI